jgi:hypothetical protein
MRRNPSRVDVKREHHFLQAGLRLLISVAELPSTELVRISHVDVGRRNGNYESCRGAQVLCSAGETPALQNRA